MRTAGIIGQCPVGTSGTKRILAAIRAKGRGNFEFWVLKFKCAPEAVKNFNTFLTIIPFGVGPPPAAILLTIDLKLPQKIYPLV